MVLIPSILDMSLAAVSPIAVSFVRDAIGLAKERVRAQDGLLKTAWLVASQQSSTPPCCIFFFPSGFLAGGFFAAGFLAEGVFFAAGFLAEGVFFAAGFLLTCFFSAGAESLVATLPIYTQHKA